VWAKSDISTNEQQQALALHFMRLMLIQLKFHNYTYRLWN